MIRKKQVINPEKTMFAHLVRLTDSDIKENRLPNYNLRCTHKAYVVGDIEKARYDVPMFLDIMNDESFGYQYFNSISDAEYNLIPEHKNELFTIGARPLIDIGIKEPCTIDELRVRLIKSGIYFNFSELDPEQAKYVKLAMFTDYDSKESKSISCTVGILGHDENGVKTFSDLINKNLLQYLYFESLNEAWHKLKQRNVHETFAYDAKSLKEIGINGCYTIEELKKELLCRKISFSDDDVDLKREINKTKK